MVQVGFYYWRMGAFPTNFSIITSSLEFVRTVRVRRDMSEKVPKFHKNKYTHEHTNYLRQLLITKQMQYPITGRREVSRRIHIMYARNGRQR